jgi:hypothetical protein
MRIISKALPLVALVLEPAELESIHQRLLRMPPPQPARGFGFARCRPSRKRPEPHLGIRLYLLPARLPRLLPADGHRRSRERTRVYQTDRELARGGLLGFSNELASVTGYVFNLTEREPTVVVALAMTLDR